MFRNWGLKKQFLTVFLILITLPTVLFGFLIYYQTTTTFKEQAEQNTIRRMEVNEETLKSMVASIENMTSYMIYDSDFRTFFKTAKEDTHEMAYKRAEESIRGYFTFQLMTHDYINSIELRGYDGNSLEFGNPVSGEEEELDLAALHESGAPTWSSTYQVESDWGGTYNVLSLTRIINDLRNINQAIGLVRVRLDQAAVFDRMEANAPLQQGKLLYYV
ncbi:cache domain-containing protein [Radiobacillus deserti]|uniref:Uncharacterized protein n=1 Tax=Radiobacillus deserti TaxID=2594883 RepID=A0A516KEY5_9BACI|nr:cache domain-containing protein [Radiobacillus deserti]QDP39940.1 hypothetical protein FN924_07030 [Radiobacillus deserti]